MIVIARRLVLVLAVLAPSLILGLPAHATGHAISMANYAFSPADATITAGDSVTWTNSDQAPHDVTTTSGPVSIHSPTLSTGQSWTYTFTVPGSYSYICSIHPDMRATLVVRPAAVATTTAAVAAPPVTRHSTASSRPAATQASSGAVPAAPGSGAPSAASGPVTTAGAAQTAPAQPVAVASGAAGGGSSEGLNPLLLVAGVVAAVATLCLLLIGSRPEPPRSET
jgi:plastocyanin